MLCNSSDQPSFFSPKGWRVYFLSFSPVVKGISLCSRHLVGKGNLPPLPKAPPLTVHASPDYLIVLFMFRICGSLGPDQGCMVLETVHEKEPMSVQAIHRLGDWRSS